MNDKSPVTIEQNTQAIELAVEMGLDLTGTQSQRMISAATHINKAYESIVRAGLLLISIKSECEHGGFGELCERHGFSSQRASESMRIAELATRLPSAKRKQVLDLPKKKVLLLASMDSDALDTSLSDDDFDPDAMSYSELVDHSRKLEKKNADLSVELNTRAEREKELKARLSNKRTESGLPDYVEIIRDESNAAAIKAGLCCDTLEQLLNDLLIQTGTNDPDLEKFNRIAASTLVIQARAAAVRSHQVYMAISEQLQNLVGIDELPADAQFSDEEVLRSITLVGDLRRDHEQERVIRENTREAKKPRKRGAPRKDKK